MTVYATTDELAAYYDPDSEPHTTPPNATVLLRAASGLVAKAVWGSVYDCGDDGIPTDAKVLAGVKGATLEQASAWASNGIDPRKGASQVERRIASKSLLGASKTYVADAEADNALSRLAAADELTAAAWQYLADVPGLLSNRAFGTANIEYFNVRQRYFDPLNGQL